MKKKITIIILFLIFICTSCFNEAVIVDETTSKTSTAVNTTIIATSTIETTLKTSVQTTINTTISSKVDTFEYEKFLEKLDSEQVIMIIADDDNLSSARLYAYEKTNGNWEKIIDEEIATVGKLGINKISEGDNRTPTGIFSIGSAFGYENDINTSYPFIELDTSHHFVEDSLSEHYNDLVIYKEGYYRDWGESEQMITYDVYKYGFIIKYNQEATPNLGSAIFTHLYRSVDSPTAGCVGISEENIIKLIKWFETSKNPLICIGDEKDFSNWETNDVVQPTRLRDDFVYLNDIVPSIYVDLKYYGEDNFLKRPVAGYLNNVSIIKIDTAVALKKVQDELLSMDYSIVLYDGYRPQKAVDDFVNWCNESQETENKEKFYPNISKNQLIQNGYIGSKSNHSKGNTVDISIIDLKTGEEIDMGSIFDFFGEISHYENSIISNEQFNNRKILHDIMIKNGFSPYSKEWWHFSYNYSEYSDATRYNFDIVF